MKKFLSLCMLSLFSLSNVYAGDGLLVGYLDYTAPSSNPTPQLPSLEDAVAHGYNMILVGFGEVNTQGAADINNFEKQYTATLAQDIQTVHQNGAKVLISFGGSQNTFTPGVGVSAETVADNIYNNIIKPYGFDGVDFDFWPGGIYLLNFNAAFIEQVIDILHQYNPNLLITGAPSVSFMIYAGDGGEFNVQPGIWADANGTQGLISSGMFDYIFVQTFSQVGASARYFLPNGQTISLGTPGVLALIYDTFMNPPSNVTKNYSLNGKTQVMIGSAVSPDAGGIISTEITPFEINKEYNCLETGKGCVNYTPSKLYPQLPGLMVWTINDDVLANNSGNQPWSFTHAVSECVLNGQCSNTVLSSIKSYLKYWL